MNMYSKTNIFLFVVTATIIFTVACKPTPDKLEKWRNAEHGIEKLSEYAQDPQMPEDVRVKAFQIVVEESVNTRDVDKILQNVDKNSKTLLADGVVDSVQKMWEKQDFPTESEVKKAGGKVNVSGSKAVVAKDIVYYLIPYADGDIQSQYKDIITDWMSTDQELRNQLGTVKLVELSKYAAEDGVIAMMKWLFLAKRPDIVAHDIREKADGETKDEVARVLNRRATNEFPNISSNLEVAILQTRSKEIVPYLRTVLLAEHPPTRLFDDAMDTLMKIKDADRGAIFEEVVKQQKGAMRWVAAARLVEIDGKDAFVRVAAALPLELDAYDIRAKWNLDRETTVFCRTLFAQLNDDKVEPPVAGFEEALASKRWPGEVLGAKCATVGKVASLKDKITALRRSREKVPRWDDNGDSTTVGKVASHCVEVMDGKSTLDPKK